MNQSKFESIERTFTVQARKVYDVIPNEDAWDYSQIMSELHRKGISMHDVNVVRGCIASLIDNGVVVEPKRGFFTKVAIRERKSVKEFAALPAAMKKAQQQGEQKPMAQQPQTEQDPIDRLSSIAKRAVALQAEIGQLSKDIEDAAIELAEREQQNVEAAAKFKRLQKLLK